jgi:hypothetical protein
MYRENLLPIEGTSQKDKKDVSDGSAIDRRIATLNDESGVLD